MIRCLATGGTAMVVLLNGACTTTGNFSEARVHWSEPKSDLGRTAIVVRRLGESNGDIAGKLLPDEVLETAIQSIASLPGTEVIRDHSLAELAPPGSEEWSLFDLEGVSGAAQEQNIDTICIFEFEQYGGAFGIGFGPLPGWHSSANIRYSLKVVETATNRVVADLHRARAVGKWYASERPKDLTQVFFADLASLLNERHTEPTAHARGMRFRGPRE